METPEFIDLEPPAPDPPSSAPSDYLRTAGGGVWAIGERLTWVAGLVLTLSAFTDWYAGSGVGVKLAVIGWHTGVLGKLVFFVGLAVLALAALREVGFELSATVPESLLVLALGASPRSSCSSASSRSPTRCCRPTDGGSASGSA